MQEAIVNFQAELLQKIQFKASSKVSTDAFLFKAFKFFDLYNNGHLSRSDFFRGIAKCGVVVETHNIDAVYNAYSNQQGNVNYKQFIQNLLFKEQQLEPENQIAALRASQVDQSKQQKAGNESKQAADPRENLAKSQINSIYDKNETYHEVLGSIKKNLLSENSNLLQLAVKLKSGDTKRTHKISKATLKSVIRTLNEEDINLIFKELSQDSKEMDYSVLIYDLKGQIQEQRLADIENTFLNLDEKKAGEFPINFLLERYIGKKTVESFKRLIELYCQFQGIDDGVFTEDDFIDFMGFLSFNALSNQQFRNQFIRPFFEEDALSTVSHKSNRSRDFNGSRKNDQNDFRKNKDQALEEKNYNVQPNTFDQFPEEHRNNFEKKSTKSVVSRHETKQVSEGQIKEVESIMLRMKKRLASKGTKGFLLFQKCLKTADIDRDGCLSYEQFKMVIKDQRIDITSTESDHIYKVFDENGLNLLNYNELMFALRGSMPSDRKHLCQTLWDRIRNGQQASSFGMLKKRLNFRNHPDILNGRRYEQDIWKEIQETILNIQELNGHTRKDTITQSQFQEYLQNLSLSIIDDKLFQTMLYHFWRLEMSSDIKQQYAGSRKLFDPSKKSYLMDHHRQVIKGGSVSQNAPFGTSFQPTNYLTEQKSL